MSSDTGLSTKLKEENTILFKLTSLRSDFDSESINFSEIEKHIIEHFNKLKILIKIISIAYDRHTQTLIVETDTSSRPYFKNNDNLHIHVPGKYEITKIFIEYGKKRDSSLFRVRESSTQVPNLKKNSTIKSDTENANLRLLQCEKSVTNIWENNADDINSEVISKSYSKASNIPNNDLANNYTESSGKKAILSKSGILLPNAYFKEQDDETIESLKIEDSTLNIALSDDKLDENPNNQLSNTPSELNFSPSALRMLHKSYHLGINSSTNIADETRGASKPENSEACQQNLNRRSSRQSSLSKNNQSIDETIDTTIKEFVREHNLKVEGSSENSRIFLVSFLERSQVIKSAPTRIFFKLFCDSVVKVTLQIIEGNPANIKDINAVVNQTDHEFSLKGSVGEVLRKTRDGGKDLEKEMENKRSSNKYSGKNSLKEIEFRKRMVFLTRSYSIEVAEKIIHVIIPETLSSEIIFDYFLYAYILLFKKAKEYNICSVALPLLCDDYNNHEHLIYSLEAFFAALLFSVKENYSPFDIRLVNENKIQVSCLMPYLHETLERDKNKIGSRISESKYSRERAIHSSIKNIADLRHRSSSITKNPKPNNTDPTSQCCQKHTKGHSHTHNVYTDKRENYKSPTISSRIKQNESFFPCTCRLSTDNSVSTTQLNRGHESRRNSQTVAERNVSSRNSSVKRASTESKK